MSDKTPPADTSPTAPEESIAAKKARATLASPALQQALADLRSVTPSGEPMFGFHVKTKDARRDIPVAEEVPISEGAAIVAHVDAAAAYVASAAPAVVPSPRMPSGRVRIIDEAAAAAVALRAAATETRRQVTQPSIARGGAGPRPPVLEEMGREEEGPRRPPLYAEEEVTDAAAVLEQRGATSTPAGHLHLQGGPQAEVPAGAARESEMGSPSSKRTGRRVGWSAVVLGALAVAGIVGVAVLRGPADGGEAAAPSATAGSSGRAAMSASGAATAAGSVTGTAPTADGPASARGMSTVVPSAPAATIAPATTAGTGAPGAPSTSASPKPNTRPDGHDPLVGVMVPPAKTAPTGEPAAAPTSNPTNQAPQGLRPLQPKIEF